eukprot:Hpha_TRINITY_DN12342_c0_g1::TRINITY_DN12342_c0_g1_i1::g.156037::m.156037
MGCGASSARGVAGHHDRPTTVEDRRGKGRKSRTGKAVVVSKEFVRMMGEPSALFPGGDGHNTAVYCVRWSPDQERLISTSRDGIMCMWNVETGARMQTWGEHHGFVLSCVHSPTDPLVVSTGDDRQIKLWSTEGGRSLATLTGHTHKVYASDFSPDGRSLITASMDHLVKVWDVDTRTHVRDLKAHTKSVFACHCLRSDLAISGGDDLHVHVWDWRTPGGPIHSLTGHTKTVWSVQLANDGYSAVSTGMDTEIRDWDLRTGHCTQVIQGHRAPVHVATLTHGGEGIISAGRDNFIRLCRRDDPEQCVEKLTGHEAAIYSAAVSPKGDLLATCSLDETVRVWSIPELADQEEWGGGDDGLGLDFDVELEEDDQTDPWGT